MESEAKKARFPKSKVEIHRFTTGSRVLNIQRIQDSNDPRDFSHFLSTFVAGVGSGALSSIICAPLDLIRTRMQVWGDVKLKGKVPFSPAQAFQEILKKEGWKGCFRGLAATLVTVPLFWGVYFPLYDETKHWATKHYGNDWHPSLVHGGAAVFTGTIADLICNPLFVVRTRLQTQALHQLAEHQTVHVTGIFQTATQLYQQHGIRIFWRGMTANLMGLSHVAIQFPAYEHLKKYARERRNDGLPETPLELLLSSGLAKMCASLLTYPHEVLRSRMMDSRSTVPPTLRGTALQIYTKEGVAGFYTGLPITLIRVIPNCCITFLSYELLLRWTKEQWQERRRRQQHQ
jgi:solute carrier family 25 folate transporter 32